MVKENVENMPSSKKQKAFISYVSGPKFKSDTIALSFKSYIPLERKFKIEDLFEKPEPLNYPNQKIKYNHYGKVIELMIEEAIKMDDIELKEKLVLAIANQMKRSYINWNLNSVDDKIILNQLTILSNQKLSLPQGTILHKVSPPPKQNQFKKKKKSNQRNHRNHSRN